MKIGVRAIPRDDEVKAWLKEPPGPNNEHAADPRAAPVLERQGFLTIESRWKNECDQPYWISFKEVPGTAFLESDFIERK